jgi:hypothetical protein
MRRMRIGCFIAVTSFVVSGALAIRKTRIGASIIPDVCGLVLMWVSEAALPQSRARQSCQSWTACHLPLPKNAQERKPASVPIRRGQAMLRQGVRTTLRQSLRVPDTGVVDAADHADQRADEIGQGHLGSGTGGSRTAAFVHFQAAEKAHMAQRDGDCVRALQTTVSALG